MPKTKPIQVWDRGKARWKLTLPSGEVIYVESLQKYCDAHDLKYQMILRKHRSNEDPYKEYKLERVNEDGSLATDEI